MPCWGRPSLGYSVVNVRIRTFAHSAGLGSAQLCINRDPSRLARRPSETAVTGFYAPAFGIISYTGRVDRRDASAARFGFVLAKAREILPYDVV